jgi:hypothetical protein
MRNALIGVAKSSSKSRKGRIGREKMNSYAPTQVMIARPHLRQCVTQVKSSQVKSSQVKSSQVKLCIDLT